MRRVVARFFSNSYRPVARPWSACVVSQAFFLLIYLKVNRNSIPLGEAFAVQLARERDTPPVGGDVVLSLVCTASASQITIS